MTSKRILLVSHELSVTGAPNSLLRQARYLIGSGHRLSLWTYWGGSLSDRFAEIGLSPRCVDNDYADLRRLAAETAVDLVICNTYVTYRTAAVFASRGTPVVWFIRETADLMGPLAADREFAFVFRRFRNLYTVSERARTFIAAINPHVRFFNNSVDDCFSAYVPIPAGALRFGFIGSMGRRKGLGSLIEAYLALKPDSCRISLTIAGRADGTGEGERLKRLTASRDDIRWLGEVTGAAKRGFFDSIDVLCVPSLDEPSGLSLIEGAMYGKALLTTDRVGAVYLVDGTNGCVVAPNRLADGLNWFLRPDADVSAMQRTSRRLYLETSTPERERLAVLQMVAENAGRLQPVGERLDRPVRQLFKKENAGPDCWRIRIFGVAVLTCRKRRVLKEWFRRILVGLGLDPLRFGYAAESSRGRCRSTV